VCVCVCVCVMFVGALQEPVNVAGRCHQQQPMLDAFSMRPTGVPCARGAVQRPPVRMMPSSIQAPVRMIVLSHNIVSSVYYLVNFDKQSTAVLPGFSTQKSFLIALLLISTIAYIGLIWTW